MWRVVNVWRVVNDCGGEEEMRGLKGKDRCGRTKGKSKAYCHQQCRRWMSRGG